MTSGPRIPHQAFMIFQLMFAAITPALITGAFAERMRFGGAGVVCRPMALADLLPDRPLDVGRRPARAFHRLMLVNRFSMLRTDGSDSEWTVRRARPSVDD